ncbi:MAG: sensor histidine kinase [Calditrichaeota bacterium]|nr:MAG: sensor histidine kinase [Calditrichota bacterium]
MNRSPRFFGRLSFRARIILTFTSLTAVLVLVFSRVGYLSVREIYLAQLADQTNLITRLIARELPPRYLTFLEEEISPASALEYYVQSLRTHREGLLLTNAFIFDDQLRILVQATPEGLPGHRDPLLLLNRTEIASLKVGESTTSLPFKGKDGQWYLWGFYRLDERHWLGIQESAARLAEVESLSRVFWGIGLGGVLLTVICGVWLARTLARPVEQLVRFSRRLGEGNFSAPAPGGISGELGILAEALDRMRRDLDRHHREKEAMLAQIAHEIRNPLGGMELLAGLVKEDLQKHGGNGEYVDRILAEIAGLKALVNAYLTYSRPQPAQPESVPVEEIVAEVEQLCHTALQEKQAQLIFEGEPLRIRFDRGHLRQVLLNLIRNSLENIGEGGRIRVRARRNGAATILTVTDDGPGIPGDHLETIFEPFFTTRANGTGLGLAVCKKLCRENRADISARNRPEGGCEFEIVLEE